MSLMNQFAEVANVTNTVNNPLPVVLNTTRVLELLGLDLPAAEPTAAEPTAAPENRLTITFDENECEPVISKRDGFEIHYSRNQVNVEVIHRPYRGGWVSFKSLCTIVTFIRNGAVIGQTAILATIESQREADAVLFGQQPVTDEIKFL
jgi:hypothetical protein